MPAALLLTKITPVHEHPEDFLDEEWIAVGDLVDHGRQPRQVRQPDRLAGGQR